MTLEVFIPGPLHNPMNGSHGHWSKRARWAKQWRERTHLALFAAEGRPLNFGRGARGNLHGWLSHETPKRITFLAHTRNRWDDDNLRAGLKPLRDALKDAGLIADDGPTSGHVFSYAQVIDRQHRGVRITVEALHA